MSYDPSSVSAYFDTFATREWDRLEATLQGRCNYAVHRRFLDEYVRPGMRVLDVGAGPGRFAIDLIASGARVTLVDLSPVQLALAHTRLVEQGMLDRVEDFLRLDVVDMRSIESSVYDLVVCYGGVISYARERHGEAVRELARVVRPGGAILLSVMSLHGALRLVGPLDAASVLETIDKHLDWDAILSGAQVTYTRPDSGEFHQPIALFTSIGLRATLEAAGLRVEKLACANHVLPQYLRVPKIEESPAACDAVVKLEVAFCDHPGLIDAGGHLIAIARRPEG